MNIVNFNFTENSFTKTNMQDPFLEVNIQAYMHIGIACITVAAGLTQCAIKNAPAVHNHILHVLRPPLPPAITSFFKRSLYLH